MTDEQKAVPPTTEGTGNRLLAEAATLFREKGYAGTSTRELSALVGIQKASLYHHVGGKEDLLYRLCVTTLDDVATIFAEVTSDTDEEPVTILERMGRRYLELALRDRDRHASMLTELRSLSPDRRTEIVARRDENVALLRSVIERAQAAGQVRADFDSKYLTLALFNLLNWSIFWYHPSGDLVPGEIGRILWTVYFEGVASGARHSPDSTFEPQREKGAEG